MKTLHSLPGNREFFDVYAGLVRSLIFAGVFAQIVSFGTEVGGINAAVLQALEPLGLGAYADTVAICIALLAGLTIEIGLRLSFPQAVDAVLYGRWHGLHLPMSIFVFLLSIVLLATSGVLSFKNSSVIVDKYTPAAEQVTTTEADSIRAEKLQAITTTYRADSTMTAANYAGRMETTEQAYQGRIKAKRAELEALKAKERRTGRSYATAKDRARQALAEIEAEKAAALAKLTKGLSDKLQALNAVRRAEEAKAGEVYAAAVDEVKAENKQAETKRAETVNGYGGGLGWFTIICQFLFVVSVILQRIQKKGSDISSTIQLSAYDFRPGWITEGMSALSDRFRHMVHSKITAFADSTPAAPTPSQPDALYDLTKAVEDVVYQLQLQTATDEDERVIELPVKEPEPQQQKRKQIRPFSKNEPTNSTTAAVDPLYATNHEGETTNHEPEKTTATNHETPDLRHAKQQLKKYKKRVGSHQQKAKVQERKSGKVCKRTADAIDNNQQWVQHWETVINQLQNQ